MNAKDLDSKQIYFFNKDNLKDEDFTNPEEANSHSLQDLEMAISVPAHLRQNFIKLI